MTNWFGSGNHELPIGVEMAKMSAANTVCLYGEGDNDSICPQVAPAHATVIKLAGGHHFGGSYEHLADVIMSGSAVGSSPAASTGSGSGTASGGGAASGSGPDHAVQ